jgi:hypothetical protein
VDNETIDDDDLEVRLGAEGVAELRTLHDKAGRLALMIRDNWRCRLTTGSGQGCTVRIRASASPLTLLVSCCLTRRLP